MFKCISKSYIETKDIAIKLASFLSAGDVICLFGDLGAGKTVFASGIAEGIHIDDSITSPTFTILNEYTGKIPFYHFDVYRLTSPEFLDMGGDEYLYGDGIVLIEWSENILDVLPSERLEIYINYCSILSENNDSRELMFKPIGRKYEDILKKFVEVIK